MAQRFRVRGSGYTIVKWAGSPVLFCQAIQDNAPRPVAGRAYEAIQGIDDWSPRELAFTRAVGEGTLVLSVYETWGREVWEKISANWDWAGVAIDNEGNNRDDDDEGGENRDTLSRILNRSAIQGDVTCRRIIKGPRHRDGTRRVKRVTEYHGARLVDVDLSDQVQGPGDISSIKNITIAYTHAARLKRND